MFLFSGHLFCFLVFYHVFRFRVMFFPLSLSLTQVTCFLFHSCTLSPITSPQYLVSRFPALVAKILTSLSCSCQNAKSWFASLSCSLSNHSLSLVHVIVLYYVVFLITGSAALFVFAFHLLNKPQLPCEVCIWVLPSPAPSFMT